MKLYIERRDGRIFLQQKIKTRMGNQDTYSMYKEVKDTPENYKDLLRWANVVGHTIEDKPPRYAP